MQFGQTICIYTLYEIWVIYFEIGPPDSNSFPRFLLIRRMIQVWPTNHQVSSKSPDKIFNYDSLEFFQHFQLYLSYIKS